MQKLIKIAPLVFMFLILINQAYIKKWGVNLDFTFIFLFFISAIYIARSKVYSNKPKSRTSTILFVCALSITILLCFLQIKRII